jgi:dTDP-4-dehydrorhamnose reductase
MTMMALVTGGRGQLAIELAARAPAGWTVVAPARADLDISDAAAVDAVVGRSAPDLILNAAAYVAVDKAESDSDTAFAVNRDGAANLARAATRVGARLAHVSTDFVFDGQKNRPYLPADATNPLGVYGASKLAGESAVMAVAPSALILRTAWVYSPNGANFMKTMLRLMAERGEVRVVADQIGTPTAASGLADTLWTLALAGVSGIHHHTDAGVASWYDFAQAIAEEGVALGLLPTLPRVTPIPTEAFPTPARRPAFSVLDKASTWALVQHRPMHWRGALRGVLRELGATT